VHRGEPLDLGIAEVRSDGSAEHGARLSKVGIYSGGNRVSATLGLPDILRAKRLLNRSLADGFSEVVRDHSTEVVNPGLRVPQKVRHRCHVLYSGFVPPERRETQSFCGVEAFCRV
jgi:hypothetical protein